MLITKQINTNNHSTFNILFVTQKCTPCIKLPPFQLPSNTLFHNLFCYVTKAPLNIMDNAT